MESETDYNFKASLSYEELIKSLKTDKIKLTKLDFKEIKNNDPKIIFKIGRIYYNLKNYSKAMAWYGRSAALNNSWAENDLGHLYRKGLGVPSDNQQAMYWYHRAARNDGNKFALCNLGLMYRHGLGVEKCLHTAIKWYTAAAKSGSLMGQYMLGSIYESEQEVCDFDKALFWYEKTGNGEYFSRNLLEKMDAHKSVLKDQK